MEWDDLRFVLAVRRAGSALRAAQMLRVNQTTVTRRIAQLEAALDVELFDRRQAGYVATEKGEQVAATAEKVEELITAMATNLAAAQRALTGTVRITTSEAMANKLVAPCVGAFQKAHPGIHVQLITENRRLDVARGEADLALRVASEPEGAGIVVRRMPDAAWAIYCSVGYAAEHGMPRCREDIAAHGIVGMEGPMAEVSGPRWLEASAPGAMVRFRCNSLSGVVSNLGAGLGVAALPCIVGDHESGLLRCFAPPSEINSMVWLIVKEDLRTNPHVRAFADFLAAHLFSIRGMMAGTGPNLAAVPERAPVQ